MMNNTLWSCIAVRRFCRCCVNAAKSNPQSESARMNRSMGRAFTKFLGKRHGYDSGLGDLRVFLKSASKETGKLSDNRRRQYSTIYAEKLAEIIGADDQLCALDLQVTKIDVDQNLRNIKIHYSARGDERDAKTSQLLLEKTGQIRGRLSSLLHGTVPKVLFVMDQTNLQVEEMNRLFEAADYGADYRTVSQPAALLGTVTVRSAVVSETLSPFMKRLIEKKEITLKKVKASQGEAKRDDDDIDNGEKDAVLPSRDASHSL